jgi:hypothetical protein
MTRESRGVYSGQPVADLNGSCGEQLVAGVRSDVSAAGRSPARVRLLDLHQRLRMTMDIPGREPKDLDQ